MLGETGEDLLRKEEFRSPLLWPCFPINEVDKLFIFFLFFGNTCLMRLCATGNLRILTFVSLQFPYRDCYSDNLHSHAFGRHNHSNLPQMAYYRLSQQCLRGRQVTFKTYTIFHCLRSTAGNHLHGFTATVYLATIRCSLTCSTKEILSQKVLPTCFFYSVTVIK